MIHPTALVSSLANIGKNVSVGPFSIIHDGVTIGDNTIIEGYCEIGYPTRLAKNQELMIGNDSVIRSHSIFYLGSHFKSGLKTGHRVTVRENTDAGLGLQIGTLSDVQGDCKIGDYVRTHSNVHIGKTSVIGNYVWIFPYVVLTNDPHPPSDVLQGVMIHDFAIISTSSTILPGITVETHALVGAHSCVTKNVPAFAVVAGVPAKKFCEVTDIKLKDGSDKSAYPWPQRFHRGYPEEVIEQWSKMQNDFGK